MSSRADPKRYAPIADYALIGDCHGVALVRRDASIDWACLTRFDSGGVFCRLLDAERGGAFTLRPRGPFESTRRYLPNTNVLETTFTTKTGSARVVDCFAMRIGGAQKPLRQLLRRVDGLRGHVTFDVVIEPRFDYASLHPWLRWHAKERVFSAVGGDDAVVLHADCPLALEADTATWRGEIVTKPRSRMRFSLTGTNAHDLDLSRLTRSAFDTRMASTVRWWQRWSSITRRTKLIDETIVRSALVLKLLTCAPTGAMVAAATTSLPELIGGARNWDYRYCWVRDATMTLGALISTGHTRVAAGFKRFIETATAGRPAELQIMYGCYGERRLPELTLDWLDGYRGSKPVRVGNGAATQTQLDVYGELLDAAHLWSSAGNPVTEDGWGFLRGLVDMACERWLEADHGLWEMRGKPQHFVYSKVMCWLAISRGIELADASGLPCERDRWEAERDAVRASVEKHGVDPKRGCYVQAYGSKELDASLLRLPMLGYVEADSPRMRATLDAVKKDLMVGPLVRRYRSAHSHDGLGGQEGTFLMASFWMVDVLAMSRRQKEAEGLYKKLMVLANDVGLFAEQYDAVAREQLGNFPQAFTHIAQINAARQLQRGRAGSGADRAVGNRVDRRAPALSTTQHTGAAAVAPRSTTARRSHR